MCRKPTTPEMFRSPFTVRHLSRVSSLLFFTVFAGVAVSGEAQEAKTNFDDHVKTILRQRCAACHGPDSKKGDLDITNFTNLMQGGSSGSVIEPGDPDGSYLYNLVTHEDEPVMPPSGKIPDGEIEVIRKWIEAGALENKSSKAVMTRKPTAVAMGENPLVRPAMVATLPKTPLQPVQHTKLNPVTSSLATSPWSPLVAVAGKNQVVLFDSSSLQVKGVLPFPEGSVNVVRFSRSGGVLLAAGGRAGSSGVAVLWDVATGERIATIGDELDAVLAADISPDHQFVALGGSSRLINVYSTASGDLAYSVKKHTDWVTALSFSTDGVLLATGDRNGGLHIWESWTGRAYLTLKGHTASINSLSWRGDSNVLASGSLDTTIRLWELNNGGQIRSWAAHAGGVNSLIYTRDGRVLSTGVDKVTKLFGQDGKQQLAFSAFGDIATAVSFCNETNRAFAGDYSGDIRVWNAADGAVLGTLTANPPTLESRIQQASNELQQRVDAAKPLLEAAAAATKAANEVQVGLDAARAIQIQARAKNDEIQAARVATSEKATKIQNSVAIAQAGLDKLTTAKPLLEAALKNMTDASANLDADEQLKSDIQQMGVRLTNLAANIHAAKSEVAALQSSLAEATSQVKATDEQIRVAVESQRVADEKVSALTTQLAPLIAARDKANVAAQSATKAQAAAEQQLARWQAELSFVNQLSELRKQLSNAHEAAVTQDAAAQQARQELEAARQKSQAADESLSQARQAVDAAEAEIRKARGIPD